MGFLRWHLFSPAIIVLNFLSHAFQSTYIHVGTPYTNFVSQSQNLPVSLESSLIIHGPVHRATQHLQDHPREPTKWPRWKQLKLKLQHNPKGSAYKNSNRFSFSGTSLVMQKGPNPLSPDFEESHSKLTNSSIKGLHTRPLPKKWRSDNDQKPSFPKSSPKHRTCWPLAHSKPQHNFMS